MNDAQKQAYIRTLVNNTNQRVADTYKYFDNLVEKAINPYKDKSDFEKTLYILGGGLYDFAEGIWTTVTGLGAAVLADIATFSETLTNNGTGAGPSRFGLNQIGRAHV